MTTLLGPMNAARLFFPRGRGGLPSAQTQAQMTQNGVNPYGAISAMGSSGVITTPNGVLLACPYKVTLVPLDNIFTDMPFEILGTTFWVNYATSNTALAYVRFNNPFNDPMIIYPPIRMDGFPFNKFWLSNRTAQAGQVIQIVTILDMNAIAPPLEVG